MRMDNKYVKLVFSGSRIETYEHDRPLMPRFQPEDGIKRVRAKIEVTDEESRQRKEEARNKAVYKARTDLTRLIYANAWHWFDSDGKPYLPVFITLTFRDDIRDLKQANHAFSNFIKRLNFRIGESKASILKYVVVPEFQDLHRGGVVHYHALFFNLPFIWKSELEEVWDEGYAKIRKIDNLDKAVGYVCKYIAKKFDDHRLDGQKRFSPSRDLLRPFVSRDRGMLGYVKDIPKNCTIKVQEYDSHYLGHVKYTQIQLKKGESIGDYISVPENFQ